MTIYCIYNLTAVRRALVTVLYQNLEEIEIERKLF